MPVPRLIVTIDTEEDEWSRYHRSGHEVTNIERIGALQELFDRFGVKPTYLVTGPVAESEIAVGVLAPILERGGCEIGGHCHPWNTPPFTEDLIPRNTMLCNLPADLQRAKLGNLRSVIRRSFGVDATAFRAGRYGFDDVVARNVLDAGFTVDSSITPFHSWRAYDGPDFNRHYPERFPVGAPRSPGSVGSPCLTEIPVSAGFIGFARGLGLPVHRALSLAPLRSLRLRGAAARIGMFEMVWLCPEMWPARQMIALSDRLIGQGRTVLNLMFHSGNLKPGLTPYVRSQEDAERFLRRVESYLVYCQAKGFESVTMSTAVDSGR